MTDNTPNWLDEAEKSKFTRTEAAAEALVEARESKDAAYRRVLTETRRALDELKARIRG